MSTSGLFGNEYPRIELWERSADSEPPDEAKKLSGVVIDPDHTDIPRRYGGPSWKILYYCNFGRQNRPYLDMRWAKEWDVPTLITESGAQKTFFKGFRFVLKINWLEIDDRQLSEFIRQMHNWKPDEVTERQVVVYPHYRSVDSIHYAVCDLEGWQHEHWLQCYTGFEGELVFIAKDLVDEIPEPPPDLPDDDDMEDDDDTYYYGKYYSPSGGQELTGFYAKGGFYEHSRPRYEILQMGSLCKLQNWW